MWNAKLDGAQAEITSIRLPGEISITSDMAEREEELNSLLTKVKQKSEKAALKLNIQKTKIMASGPITSWQIDGETMETVRDYFLGLQYHCRWWRSHDLLLGRKAMTNRDSILKSRETLLCQQSPSSQSYDFSSSHVWMWELDYKEGWALKNWCFWIGAGEDPWVSFGQQGDQTS